MTDAKEWDHLERWRLVERKGAEKGPRARANSKVHLKHQAQICGTTFRPRLAKVGPFFPSFGPANKLELARRIKRMKELAGGVWLSVKNSLTIAEAQERDCERQAKGCLRSHYYANQMCVSGRLWGPKLRSRQQHQWLGVGAEACQNWAIERRGQRQASLTSSKWARQQPVGKVGRRARPMQRKTTNHSTIRSASDR